MVMTTMSSRIAALCVGLVTLGALSGCSFFAEDELPTLERDPTAADVLPSSADSLLSLRDRDDPSESDGMVVDFDSVRLAGEYAGYQVFLAHGESDSEYCLIVVATESSVASCNDSQQVMTGADPGLQARTTRDGIVPADEGEWIVLTDDVIVQERAADE